MHNSRGILSFFLGFKSARPVAGQIITNMARVRLVSCRRLLPCCVKSSWFVIGWGLLGLCSHAWAANLPFGQPQTGTISSAAQSNSYTFGANAKDVVNFTVVATSGNLSPKIDLYGPGAALLSYNYNGNPFGCSGGPTLELNSVTLPDTGTYTVVIADCSDTNTGNYTLFAQRTNDPTGATNLQFGGQPQAGTISSAAQSNSYTFGANAKDVVNFTVVAASGGLSPKIDLYGPTGAVVSYNYNGNPFGCSGGPTLELNSVTLPDTGTYTVLIADCSDTNTGTYTIFAQRTNNPAGAINLQFGGQPQAGTISSVAQSNSYTFGANAKDVVNFTVVAAGGGLSPKIDLYGPTGAVVSYNYNGNPFGCSGGPTLELNSVTLPDTGTYTVLIADCSDTNTGTYTIFVQRTNNPAGAINLQFGGQPQTGTIGSVAQSNSYTFGANAKDVINFTVVAASGGLSPKIDLYGPTGALLSYNYNGNPFGCSGGTTLELNNVTLPDTGTYTVLIADCSDTNTGNYSLSAQCFGVCVSPVSTNPSYIVSSATLSFAATVGGASPLPQTLTLTSATSGLTFTASASAPWISVNPVSGSIPAQVQVSVILTGLGQGPHQGAITITVPSANPNSTTLTVALVVAGSGPPATVEPLGLSFSLTQGGGLATQSVTIGNNSNRTLAFTTSANVNSGANWLSVSPSGGTIPPFASANVAATVDPSLLQAGTFSGTITIAIADGQSFTISVLVTVSSRPNMILSASGVRFQAVVGGSVTPPQTIQVVNSGAGTLNFSVTVSTISGGNWLSVSPSSNTISGSSASSVVFSVKPAGLAEGDYYGQAIFSAPGAANSPQIVSFVLSVLALANSPGAFVQPTGLIFIGSAGGSNPAAKSLSITNPSSDALNYLGTVFTDHQSNWLTVTPVSGSLSATRPASVSLQPTLLGLAAGVYIADLVLNIFSVQAPTQGQTLQIEIVLIVLPAGSSGAAEHFSEPHASGCTPTKLLPVFTQLETGFSAAVAWPTPIEVTVVDDCGNPLTTGSVTASFSDGDPSLPLASFGNGSWSATWQPGGSAAQVVITVNALETAPPLAGAQSIGGALQANPNTPAINPGGVVSTAKNANNQPLAPGALVSIYGVNLSDGPHLAPALPLGTELGSTRVVLGGRLLPLQYAGDNQVNAVIPYDVPPNSTQQIIVTNGTALSVPEAIAIAQAQPDVFAQADGSAVAFGVKPGSSEQVLVDAEHPVSAGDAIVIYCAGLGAVNPPATTGGAAPSSPAATTINPATVTIGGQTAPVFFGGLVGGFAGLYQVNAYVPKGITPGNAVPLIVSVAGLDSAPVTIAVK